MAGSIAAVQQSVADILNALPGVFSTVQWGGRAYKVGTPRKFKLLAHVYLSRNGDTVYVDFKLDRKRAAQVVDDHDWIEPHSFRTLAPAGWISAAVRTKSQCKVVAKLLAESRAMYSSITHEKPSSGSRNARGQKKQIDPIVRRMDAILREKRESGWSPEQAEFD